MIAFNSLYEDFDITIVNFLDVSNKTIDQISSIL